MYFNGFSDVTLIVQYKYSVTRTTYASDKMAPTITGEPSYNLLADDPARAGLLSMLRNNSGVSVTLPHLFPKFLKVIILIQHSFFFAAHQKQ